MAITDLQHARNVMEKLRDALKSAEALYERIYNDEKDNLPTADDVRGILAADSTSANELGEGSAEPTPTMGTSAPDTLPPGRDERTQAEDRGASPLYPSGTPEGALAWLKRRCEDILASGWKDGSAPHAICHQLLPVIQAGLDASPSAGTPTCGRTTPHPGHPISEVRCPGVSA